MDVKETCLQIFVKCVLIVKLVSKFLQNPNLIKDVFLWWQPLVKQEKCWILLALIKNELLKSENKFQQA